MSIRNISSAITLIPFVFISICFADPNNLPYKQGEVLVEFSLKADGTQRTKAERNSILSATPGATIKKNSKFVPSLTLVL